MSDPLRTRAHRRWAVDPSSTPSAVPASFAQRRIWFLQQLDESRVAYNEHFVLRAVGPLVIDVLRQALVDLVRRHSMLRSALRDEGGSPWLHVVEDAEPALTYHDVSGHGRDLAESMARDLARRDALLPFDLSTAPLVRFAVIRLAESVHEIAITNHHVISDAWSRTIISQELVELYESRASGRASRLAALGVSYADYAWWQQERARSGAFEHAAHYWRQRLEGVETLDLPAAGSGASEERRLPLSVHDELWERLPSRAKALRCSVFSLVVTAFASALARYFGGQDIVVGTTVAGRDVPEVAGCVGLFINVVPLRVDLRGAPTMQELCARVGDAVRGALAHQEYPFELLVESLGVRSREPLFGALVTVTPASEVDVGARDLRLSVVDRGVGVARYGLVLELEQSATSLRGALVYAHPRFSDEVARGLAHAFVGYLEAAVEQPGLRVADVELSEPSQARGVEAERVGPATPLTELIARGLEQRSDTEVIVSDAVRLTGRQLSDLVERRALELREHGVERGDLVAVRMTLGPDLIAVLLAVWRLGAAYVPVPFEYPAARAEFVLRDSGARVCVRDERGPSLSAVREVVLSREPASAGARDDLSADARSLPSELAYVMYTSGSTGQPKGVMVTHGNLSSFAAAIDPALPRAGTARWLASTSFGFDISVLELFVSLARGDSVAFQGAE